jgi:NADPH:quinone reductase-like Zn-dependent oxidoreductase
LSPTDAATIPLNALTARLALDRLGLAPGASLAITGAAGALGGYAIQLAKMDGLTVVAAGSADDAHLLTGLGADVVVERGREVGMTRDAIPGGVDAAIDCAVVGKEILAAIRDEGQLASVRAWRDPSERGIVIRPIWITDYITNAPALQQLAGLAGSGRLVLRVAHQFAPERVGVAHRLLEAGGLRGRCVITFD